MYLKRYLPLSRACALLNTRTPPSYSRGFSLIEVMVALVVLSIGLLGVAKLETVALSSTTVASQRSLAAIEAASLAATMHLNRGYWAGRDPGTPTDTIGAVVTVTGAPPSTTTITATTNATILGTSLGKTQTCYSTTYPAATAVCPAVADLAAYDLQKWAAEVQSVLPNYSATIKCGSGTPLACEINITWNENAVAVNTQEANVTTAMPSQSPSYTLYVQP